MLKNGRPYTSKTDTGLITDHSEEEQKRVFEWIKNNIVPRKTVLYKANSYRLKHFLQRDTNIYLTNNEFKDAMLMCGYVPENPDDPYWRFAISAKSPAFRLGDGYC